MARHRSAAEQRVFVEAFGRSGMSKSAFASAHGISVSSLQRWRRMLREVGPERGAFLEVRQDVEDDPSWSIQVANLPQLTFGQLPEPEWLARFVRSLVC